MPSARSYTYLWEKTEQAARLLEAAGHLRSTEAPTLGDNEAVVESFGYFRRAEEALKHIQASEPPPAARWATTILATMDTSGIDPHNPVAVERGTSYVRGRQLSADQVREYANAVAKLNEWLDRRESGGDWPTLKN